MVTIITKFMLLFILCVMVSTPVSADTLEFSSLGINIYSDVNNSWDYSTRYEMHSVKCSESSTSYSISCSGSEVYTYQFVEYLKPEQISIDFNLNSGLNKIIAKSQYVASTDFIEGSSFNLMSGANCIGYGSFFMWADPDNADKLLYLYEFDSLDDLSGVGTFDIVYSDDSIFDSLPLSHILCTGNTDNRCSVNPSGSGAYLLSTHYTNIKSTSTSDWYQNNIVFDEMATTNTLTNFYISNNDVYYYYNISSYVGYVEIDNKDSSYRLGITHNLTSSNTVTSNDYHTFDGAYTTGDQLHSTQRNLGVKFDLYTDPTQSTPTNSYVLDWGGSYCGPTGYYAFTSVDWDAGEYVLGDTGSISYLIDNYDSSTYDYSINIYKSDILQAYLSCSSGSGLVDYTFSDITDATSYSAKLTKYVKGSVIPLLLDCDDCMVYMDFIPGSCQIIFDKEIYGLNDLVNMSYYGCPDGSHIIFGSDESPYYDSKTYVSISGDGYVTYQLSSAPVGVEYYAKACTPGNIVIASDTMMIEGSEVGYCQVYGGIYDSQDSHPLIGTVFIGDSYSDVVGYSDYGAYSIIVPWGTYDISAVVSSYLTHNISNVIISGSSYDLNMFLSVNDTTTHVFRGSVTDADTNAAIENVLIKVYNDTFDEYDFTSQSGVWVVNGLTSGANYILHATKDDYHPYTYSFTYDPGDFYHNFMMSSVVVEDDVIEDVLEDDETMTEYFDDKFREFAPTAWGIFLLSVVLWLMAILSSFGGSNKRR